MIKKLKSKKKTLRNLIKNRINQATTKCKFKDDIIKAMKHRGWGFIHVDTFAKELEDEIRESLMTGEIFLDDV